MRVLVLGGTVEGREAATLLAASGHTVITSLAGRTEPARREAPGVVTGGFGGPEGLADYLRAQGIDAVVDATHPFAARMSAHAALACGATATPLVRWQRPGWEVDPRAGEWTWVADHDAAARACVGARHVFLTVGRQPLPHYAALPSVTARVAEAPAGDPPPGWTILAVRGPFTPAAERALLREVDADVLVTKNSGGRQTAAKLDAAAALGVRVVVVRRPPAPDGVETVADAAGLTGWLTHR